MGDVGDHIQVLIDTVSQAPPTEFAVLPRIKLHGSPACDAGGVFTDKINLTFNHLLRHMDLFELNRSPIDSPTDPPTDPPTDSRYVFKSFSHTVLKGTKKLYQVFGKLLYWFVIVHEQIPFPNDLSPAILAFCVYGYIPLSLTRSLDSAAYEIATKIQNLDVDTLVTIPKEIGSYVNTFGIHHQELLESIRDPNQGPHVNACRIATKAILGWHTKQFEWVREGFTALPQGHNSV